MTTYRLNAPTSRPRTWAWAWLTDLRLGGTLMFVAGIVILMGIITAEALYPVTYTTSGNEISDLGGTRPPEALVFQPSSTGSSGGRSSPSA